MAVRTMAYSRSVRVARPHAQARTAGAGGVVGRRPGQQAVRGRKWLPVPSVAGAVSGSAERPAEGGGPLTGLGGAHLGGTRALGARFDLELDALAADEAIEVQRGIE